MSFLPGPEYILTKIARKWCSLQMVCFNVSLYANAISFFSTELANAGKCSLSVLSLTGHIVLTLFHQGVHHLVQFGKVFRIGDCQDRRLVIWNLPCACFYQISDFSSFAMGSDFGSSCADLVSSSLSSFSPKKPFSFSSSARAKKDSRFSWRRFASPW